MGFRGLLQSSDPEPLMSALGQKRTLLQDNDTLRDGRGAAPWQELSDAVECLTKDRDALLTFYVFPAEPPAISGGAGLEHPWCAAAAGNDA